jgi:mono/diheme cytochrome c family protein
LDSDARVVASFGAICAAILLALLPLRGQDASFQNAPLDTRNLKDPYEDHPPANARLLYHRHCTPCHGENGEGSGNLPALAKGRTQSVADGEIFWYVTKGDANSGMPWSTLPPRQRWEIVSYVKALGHGKIGAEGIRRRRQTPPLRLRLSPFRSRRSRIFASRNPGKFARSL